MNDEAQLLALRQRTKAELAKMVFDLQEELRMPQDMRATISILALVLSFFGGVVVGAIL